MDEELWKKLYFVRGGKMAKLGKISCTFMNLVTDHKGRKILSFVVNPEHTKAAENLADRIMQLKEDKLLVEVDKYKKMRSLSANAYCWVLCGDIAAAINTTDKEVYKDTIRDVGKKLPFPIADEEVANFERYWNSHGTGWITEIVGDSKLPGYKLIHGYVGSSEYDTAEMSRLIDYLIITATEMGIDTITPAETERLMQNWEESYEQKNKDY